MSSSTSEMERELRALIGAVVTLNESINALNTSVWAIKNDVKNLQDRLENEVNNLRRTIEVTRENLEERINESKERLEQHIMSTKVELNRRINEAEDKLNRHLIAQGEILEMNSDALLSSIALQLLCEVLGRAASKTHIIIGQLDGDPLLILEESDQIQLVLLARKNGKDEIKELEKQLRNYTGKKVVTDVLTMRTTKAGIVRLAKLISHII